MYNLEIEQEKANDRLNVLKKAVEDGKISLQDALDQAFSNGRKYEGDYRRANGAG